MLHIKHVVGDRYNVLGGEHNELIYGLSLPLKKVRAIFRREQERIPRSQNCVSSCCGSMTTINTALDGKISGVHTTYAVCMSCWKPCDSILGGA